MNSLATNVSVAYFGKLPSRGDFVKSGASLPLLTSLDNWLARAMDNMSTEPRWKTLYDEVNPFHFAFVGPRSKLAIAGQFTASADTAKRRFPFVMAVTLEVVDAKTFLFRCPLALSGVWSKLAQLSADAVSSNDATHDLSALSGVPLEVDTDIASHNTRLKSYLEGQSMGSLTDLLRSGGFDGDCRQLILGLGLLLQPVMASGSNRLDKSLCLPLPQDPMAKPMVAAFWLALINPFLLRADFELAIFMATLRQRHVLIVGFSGASSVTLEAMLNPDVAQDHFIDFDDAKWVEETVQSDYGVAKVSGYLEQPRLSLLSAKQYFNEVFLGL